MDCEQKKMTYVDEIMSQLENIDIYKVILFGSLVSGSADEESDIDLLIVLDDNTIPKSYEEWLTKKMKVRTLLREINGKVALDLLIYTKPQYEQLIKDMNSFHKEIEETGKVLYEKAS